MKHLVFLNILTLPLILGACASSNGGASFSSTSASSSIDSGSASLDESPDSEEGVSSEATSEEASSTASTEESEEETISITLSDRELDLVKGKYQYLAVNFPEGYAYDPEGGEWVTSNEEVASVSPVGKVTALKEGDAYIRYIASTGVSSASCLVHVYDSAASIQREWVKVDDMNSIAEGDRLIFGCPEFGVVATLDRVDGYLKAKPAAFSDAGAKLSSFDEAADFYAGEEGESFLLENQEGQYLAGRHNDYRNGLSFLNNANKGQTHWIFETPEGYEKGYCVNYDIEDDLWLMFNKVNDSDIRFNLYDSNETAFMKLSTVYRYQIVR